MTSADDWTKLKDLFDRAAGLDAGDRADLLDGECATEPEIRRRVDALLAAHDAAGGFLTAPTSQPTASLDDASRGAPGFGPGATIGPYKLLQQIGEGGFGVVYMAEQQQPIVRRVALKVIKLGMDTKQVIARFDAERQALALMDHLNIARIFDAGATDSGRPYFVMELVHGVPITEYCDRERLSLRERLEIFLPVCRAVAHAHQKGIIHRDLKPSNVLVTLHDGRPVPKVIDFGVAKALHQKLTERTLFTEFGQFIGTPAYMSPEQSEMSGLDIDTRTDIYSLGTLLYELLTGQNLFEPQRLRSLALREIQRVLQEEEPPRPSARVLSLGATSGEVARLRGLQSQQLVRFLHGDPDWIVMKAIAKDRRKRYDSAGALAEDIERCLRSEAVSAGPPSLSYRASRFLRRHRLAAAVTATVLVAIVAGGTLATIGFVQARRAEAVARREARLNALEADALRSFVRWDFSAYVTRTREAIGLKRVASKDSPRELAIYLADLVSILDAMTEDGDAPSPMDTLRHEIEGEALHLVVAMDAPGDSRALQVVDAMIEYATSYRRDYLIPLLHKSIALRSGVSSSDPKLLDAHRRLAKALDEEGLRLLAAGRPTDAKPLLEESVARDPHLAHARGSLGFCLMELGEYPAAESLLVAAWDRLDSRELLARLVDLYRRWGKPELARRYADQTVVDEVRELAPLPTWSSIVSRDVCYSGVFRGRAVWMFGETGVRRGDPRTLDWLSNTWCWSKDRDARDGVTLEQPTDPLGVPVPLIRYTPDERVHMAADTSGSIRLWPGPLIEDPARHRALIVYRKGYKRQKPTFDIQDIGSSIAVWSDFAAAPMRPVLRLGTAEPTLLFQGDEPQPSAGAVLARDTLFLYGTKPVFLSRSVFVACAPLARALERGAWRFYAGDGRWIADWKRATELMLAGPHLSVHWNAHLRRYVAVTSQGYSGEIELRTALRPEGPWSRRHVVGTGLKTARDGQWNVGALAHPELSRDGGRIEYLTYRHPIDMFNHEIRLMEIVFH